MNEVFKDLARPEHEHKTRERVRKTAEVFTPPELIKDMLDRLPPEIFQAGKLILEPAAGNGNFVIAVLERKLQAACTPLQAIQDVYAVEYMLDNVEVMKQRILTLLGDTEEIRKVVNEHIAYANTLDPSDTSEGRCFPDWLLETENVNNLF